MIKNYGAVENEDQLRALANLLSEHDGPMSYDIETGYDGPDTEKGALDPDRAYIVGFSVSTDPSWARYVPLRHDFANNVDWDLTWQLFAPILSTKKIVPHHAKFEKRFTRQVLYEDADGQEIRGIELNVFSDTMIEYFLLSEFGSLNSLGVGLKHVTKQAFDHDQAELASLFPDLKGKKLSCVRFNVIDLTPEVIAYACEDAAWTIAHHLRNYDKVKDTFLYKVEMEIMEILCDMEDWGVLIDYDMMRRLAAKGETFIGKQNNAILADFSAITGSTVSINVHSPAQLQTIIFDKMGLTSSRKTPTGKPSTDAVAMEALSKKVPVIKKLLEMRETEALFKRYLDKWPREFSHYSDGRAHPNVNQVIVGTGRLAVNDPPMQQIPKKFKWAVGVDPLNWDKVGKDPEITKTWEELPEDQKFYGNMRDIVMAPEGWYLLDFDYSQVELRVMAGLSQEPALIAAFNEGLDVHTITAAMMLHVPASEITEEQRAIGKTMNFALLYGMGVRSLSDRLAITLEEARILYNAYFSGFASITAWMEKMKEQGKARGHTISWAGRKYTIHELQSSNMAIYSKGERVCVNAPVQGGAADYMKVAMCRLHRSLTKLGWWGERVQIVMNNHDALTFQVRDDLPLHEIVPVVREAVEFPVQGFPKIVAEFSAGQRWGSMKDVSPDGFFVDSEEKSAEWEPELDEDGEPILPDIDLAAFRSTPNGSSAPVPDQASHGDASLGADGPAAQGPAPHTVPDVVKLVTGAPEHSNLVVTVTSMPSESQFANFVQYCNTYPGTNTVCLNTPEGSLDLPMHVKFGPDQQPQVSLHLGGATVSLAPSSVDVGSLAGDLNL